MESDVRATVGVGMEDVGEVATVEEETAEGQRAEEEKEAGATAGLGMEEVRMEEVGMVEVVMEAMEGSIPLETDLPWRSSSLGPTALQPMNARQATP